MLNKENRTVAQIIEVICATCGKPTKVNNRYEETPFFLHGGELYYHCPHCHSEYDMPMTWITR